MVSTRKDTEYVSLDVEATGLNPHVDNVIEVAVVVFTESEIISQWSHLVRPKQSLGKDVSSLTGISQEMLDSAPRLSEIEDELRERIGDRPIVGHNIGFDLSMLAADGFTSQNPVIDTYTLATGLLHDVPNFQLGTLATYVGYEIPPEERHRALGDAVATVYLFQDLVTRLRQYDSGTLRQIGQFARQAAWKDAWFFEDVARQAVDAPLFDPQRPATVPLELNFLVPRDRPEGLRPTGNHDPIDIELVERLLGADGPLNDVLTGFQPRPTQITMARRVAESLNKDQNLLVEAGTGTGKSLAYLLPAAMFAVQRGERVVVSTNTIALQDQLYNKDLPDVRVAMMEAGVANELRVAVMKGRQNYLCLKQFFLHKDDPIEDEADASLRAKILLWLGHTQTGDKAELRLNRDEERYWRRYASERGRCTPGRCSYAGSGQCFFHRARFNAQAAHIVIANHSLVLANAAESRVLPQFERLIVDEAHHLEDEATRQLSFSVTSQSMEDTLRGMVKIDSGSVSGFVPTAASVVLRMTQPVAQEYHDAVRQRTSHVERSNAKINLLTTELFKQVGDMIPKPRGGSGYAQNLRITDMLREGYTFSDAAHIWEELAPEIRFVAETGAWLMQVLEEIPLPDDPGQPLVAMRDDAIADLMIGVDETMSIISCLDQVFRPSIEARMGKVFWIQRSVHQQEVSVNGAPLDISELLNQKVYSSLRSVIMTSATMTIDGKFDFLMEHLGMEGSKKLDLGSPFDHEKSTLIYVPDDMPEPNHPGYNTAMYEALYETLRATNGRALVLFTSHRALRDARDALKEPLEQHNIVVLGQSVDGNTRALIDRLRTDPGTVVFGTSTFWEGVDVIGDALSLLVIAKFPFAVPTDPVFEARSEQYENPFMQLSLPLAVLKFKQGFGRLIRTSHDRGVCVILDKRAVSKRYGSMFVQSLPPANVHYGSVYDLPETAREWIRPVTS